MPEVSVIWTLDAIPPGHARGEGSDSMRGHRLRLYSKKSLLAGHFLSSARSLSSYAIDVLP